MNEYFIIAYQETYMESNNKTIPLTICDSLAQVQKSTGIKNTKYLQQLYQEAKQTNMNVFSIGGGFTFSYQVTICNMNQNAEVLAKKFVE